VTFFCNKSNSKCDCVCREKKSEKEISDYYTQSYLANLVRYNIIFPTHSPQVTNYIPQIQEFINILLTKEVAYQKKGEIFFRVGKSQEYGKISGQDLGKLRGGMREINQTNKEDSRDFVLWKKTTEGIAWNSP
jgi:cysteinyl-tRNA synthetase